MKTRYSNLLNDSELILEQLNRNQAALKSLQKTLPPVPTKEEKDKIETLHAQLKEEMAEHEKLFQFYSLIKSKLKGNDGLLRAIDNVRFDKVHYIYKPKGVSCQAYTDKIPDKPKSAGSANKQTTATINASPAQFFLHAGKSFVYDVEYENNKNSAFKAEGRFTQQFEESFTATTNKKGQIIRNPACTFTVVSPPASSAAKSEENAEKLLEANVIYYMDLAVSLIIANGGNPPSKDYPALINGTNPEQMRYLWTAMMVLGEGKPKFGAEVVVVEGGAFNPADEKNFFGFKGDSLYNKVFKNPLYIAQVEQRQKALEQYVTAGVAVGTVKEKTNSAVADFKQKLDKSKADLKETSERLDKEGPAPHQFKPSSP